MGQSIPRWPMTGRVWHLAELLSFMIERTGASGAAARLDGGDGLLEARARCHGCVSTVACEQFLAEPDPHTPFPAFCPNSAFLQRCLDARQTGGASQLDRR